MTDRAGVSEGERLDEETERLIQDVHCRRPRALPALRKRILQLIEDASHDHAMKLIDWMGSND